MERIREIIHVVHPISTSSLSKILTWIEYEEFSREETFIQLNRWNHKEYFLLKGIVRSYLTDPEGKDITISFFSTQSVISPHVIRSTNGKSNLNYQALTDIQLATIDAIQFRSLMLENSDIRDFANKVLEKELIGKVQKEIGLTSLTAKERLIHLRQQFPLLENLVPHPYIASYLGITNTSLSRLRKELTKY
jgi:CRP-like cAMP-binding protein